MTKQVREWLKTTLVTAVDKMSDDVINQLVEDKALNIHITISDDKESNLVCTSGMTGANRRNFLAMK